MTIDRRRLSFDVEGIRQYGRNGSLIGFDVIICADDEAARETKETICHIYFVSTTGYAPKLVSSRLLKLSNMCA